MKDRVIKVSKTKNPHRIISIIFICGILGLKYPNYGSVISLEGGCKCYDNVIESKDSEMSEDEKHNLWKENVPYLYDSILNDCEIGESSYFCMCYGKDMKESRGNNKVQSDNIFFSSKSKNSKFNNQTGYWEGVGEQIYMCSAELKPVNSTLLTFVGKYAEHTKNNSINTIKKIIHPDNIIKMQSQTYSSNMLFTLSKSSLIHIWDMDNQSNRTIKINNEPNIPSLSLECDKEDSNENVKLSTLLVNRYIQRILSSYENKVLVWDLEDCEKTEKSKKFYENEVLYNILPNRLTLTTKNDNPITAVEYNSLDQSGSIIVGGSLDSSLYIWDIRCSNEAINTIPKLHNNELTSIGFEQIEGNMIAVGFDDGIIKLLDNRYIGTSCNSSSRNENSGTANSSLPSSPISSRSDNTHLLNHKRKESNNNEIEEEEDNDDDDEKEEERGRELDRFKVKEESEEEMLLNEKNKLLLSSSSSISNPNPMIVSQLRSGYCGIKELKWSPHKSGYLCVCSDDIVIWNTSNASDKSDILFRHSGHRGKLLSFDWHSISNWTIGSASNEVFLKDKEEVVMCNIQLWRISELITNDFDRNTIMDWSKV